jgi:chemotaxis protein CheZ
MTHTTDDLDALFDEVAAEFSSGLPKTEPQAAPRPMSMSMSMSIVMLESDSELDASVGSAADQPIYDRLGGILRQLHDSLRELGYDRFLSDVVEQVSDSKSRLEYIAKLTEEAANKVLNAVDEGLPVQEAQAESALQLSERWNSMFAGALSVDAFKVLAHDSHAFINATAGNSEIEKERLLSIMMAQDFQDITGQIIKKVVTLTQNLEQQLAQLLRDFAPNIPREEVVDLLAGPSTSALIQDDVDGLLSDLGF